MTNQTGGFRRIIRAWGFSWRGISAAWQHEAAFRQEVCLALLAILIACWLDLPPLSRLLLIGSVLLVLIVELLNSAIEAVVDRISHEWHELAGRAKDMGSAAVFISILLACLTWGIVLWAHYHG